MTTNGAERIAAERQRQVEAEGWTPEHDDEHTNAEMATAGVGYAMFAVEQLVLASLDEEMPEVGYDRPPAEVEWPWHPDWWKPSTDPIRNLEKAGALIAAEIDRLQRAEPSGSRGRPMAPDPGGEKAHPITWGSYASVLRDRREVIVRTVAETLASGGPIEDEMDAAEQVVAALERLYRAEGSDG